MRIKFVMRYDSDNHVLRLFRLLWTRGVVGDGEGYSAKLAFALAPVFFRWGKRDSSAWFFYLFGLRVSYLRSYGGVIA